MITEHQSKTEPNKTNPAEISASFCERGAWFPGDEWLWSEGSDGRTALLRLEALGYWDRSYGRAAKPRSRGCLVRTNPALLLQDKAYWSRCPGQMPVQITIFHLMQILPVVPIG